MRTRVDHWTEEDLLRFRGGELSGVKAWWIRRHLAGCEACRMRSARQERALAEISQLYQVKDAREGARAQLKAGIDAAQRVVPRRSGLVRSAAAYGVGLAVVLAVVTMSLHVARERQRTVVLRASSEDRPVPRASLTPGATRAVSFGDICPLEPEEEDQDPAVPASMRNAIFREYGMPESPAMPYQVDYLISPQLGGTDDMRNLWPQPYGETVWNARAKDALETRLHEMVCERQIDLEEAQRAIATDWIGAYRRVFGTESPL